MRVPQQLQVNSIRVVMVPWRKHKSASSGMGMAEYLAEAWGLKLQNSDGLQEVDDKSLSYHLVGIDSRDLEFERDSQELKRSLVEGLVTVSVLHEILALALKDGLLEAGHYLIVNYP